MNHWQWVISYNDSPDFDSTAGRCCDISISESERAIDGSKLDSDWSQRSAAEVVLARLNRRRFWEQVDPINKLFKKKVQKWRHQTLSGEWCATTWWARWCAYRWKRIGWFFSCPKTFDKKSLTRFSQFHFNFCSFSIYSYEYFFVGCM